MRGVLLEIYADVDVANVVCFADREERSIVLASMNLFSNAVNAWWPLCGYSFFKSIIRW